MSAGSAQDAALTAIQVGAALVAGDMKGALRLARLLVDEVILLVPPGDLKDDLTDTDRTFGDLAADVAEQIKVGSST